MRLTMQDQRIDGAPDVVHRGVTDDLNLAGFGLDLDFADLRAVGKAGDRKRLVGDAGDTPCRFSGNSLRVTAAAATSKMPTSRSVAGDTVSAALELNVDFASLEQEAGDLATLVDDIVGRLADNGGSQLH